MKALTLIKTRTIQAAKFCYVHMAFIIGMLLLTSFIVSLVVNCMSEYGISAYVY